MWGFRTGAGTDVIEPPDTHRSSQVALPMMWPPASRIRCTTVASTSGMNPSSSADPFVIGTPARQIESFSATVFPASLPLDAPCTEQRQYHPRSGLSSNDG